MTHEELSHLLDAWLDHELDAATSVALEAHLRGCAECQARLEQRRALRQRLQAAAQPFPLPPALRARIEAQLRARRPRQLRAPSWPQALAAGVLVALGAFLLGRDLPRAPDLRAELVNASVRSLLSTHPIDVESSDHHTVKPWLSSQLPFSPPVPELASQDESLLGGRVDYVGQTPVAALLYRHGHHRITVYLWPRSLLPAPAAAPEAIDGYRLLTAAAGDFTAVIVSDMSAAELAAFRARWLQSAATGGGPGPN